jgi:hypothetical protein
VSSGHETDPESSGVSRRGLLVGGASVAARAACCYRRRCAGAGGQSAFVERRASEAGNRGLLRGTTDQSSKNFVAAGDCIATFDRDGTLWVEHPLYTQAMFAID